MVVTVEPGIYLPKNDFDLPEEFRGIGIRIEDDVVVRGLGDKPCTGSCWLTNICSLEQITETGIEVTTSKVPKELQAMEALRYE